MKQPVLLLSSRGKSKLELERQALQACVKLFRSLGMQEKVREFKTALDKLK